MPVPTRALLAVLLAAASVRAGHLHVPGDFALLQDAVDAAVAGDVVVVDGGSHPPVVVDVAITLAGVASNRPTIRPYQFFEPGAAPLAPVTLAGPGTGTVTLVALDVGGTLDEVVYTSSVPGVGGGGFDLVRVLHCDVAAPAWPPLGNPTASPSIEVDVPDLLVADCEVTGGEAGFNGGPWIFFDLPDGGAGVASTGDVDVLGSTVTGGDGFDVVFEEALAPADCGPITNGEGGAAVTTPGAVRHAGSLLQGGEGATVAVDTGGVVVVLCERPDGSVIAAGSEVALPGGLGGPGPAVLAAGWELLSTGAPPGGSLLVGGLLPRVPPLPVGEGLLYMDPTALRFFSVPSGSTAVSFRVPNLPEIVGLPVVFQRYDAATNALTNPVFTTFVAP